MIRQTQGHKHKMSRALDAEGEHSPTVQNRRERKPTSATDEEDYDMYSEKPYGGKERVTTIRKVFFCVISHVMGPVLSSCRARRYQTS